MFCPNCGTQNPEGTTTCTKCGFAMKSAAPKFKGTMLMANSPPLAAPKPAAAPAPAAGAPPPSGDPSFSAEAKPIGGSGATGANSAPSRLKGTIVGVAPPNAGAAAPGPAAVAPDHSFGSQAVNPLGGTMAVDQPSPFAPGAPPPGGNDFGAPPPPGGGAYSAPPVGAPPPGFGAPPAGDAFGAPPPPGGGYGGAPPPGGGYGGAPPPGGGYGGAPPPGGGYGGAPPPGQQDFGQPMNQGYNQMGQGVDQFGNPMNQPYGAGQQPYPGGPMMGPQGGPMMAGGPGKSFMTTLLLAIFAGTLGVHRFYTGHTVYGIIQLVTCGGMGVWTLIDIIFIVTGKYTDAQGRPLVK